MTNDSMAKNALNSDIVRKLMERLGPNERAHVERFAVQMSGMANEAIAKSHAAVSGEMPTTGISDAKGGKDGV